MTKIDASVEISATAGELFQAWSRYEDFPRFMEAVELVSTYQDGDATFSEWKLEVAGQVINFQAKVVERIPERRVAWQSTTNGLDHRGAVEFERIDESLSRVRVELEYEPDGVVQWIGDLIGTPGRLLERNLLRFKHWVEEGRTLENDPPPSISEFLQQPIRGRLL